MRSLLRFFSIEFLGLVIKPYIIQVLCEAQNIHINLGLDSEFNLIHFGIEIRHMSWVLGLGFCCFGYLDLGSERVN